MLEYPNHQNQAFVQGIVRFLVFSLYGWSMAKGLSKAASLQMVRGCREDQKAFLVIERKAAGLDHEAFLLMIELIEVELVLSLIF